MSLLTFYFLTVLRTPSFFWSVRSIMFLVRTHLLTFRNIDAVCLLFLSLLFAVFISTLILASRCHIPFIFFSFSCFFFFLVPQVLTPMPNSFTMRLIEVLGAHSRTMHQPIFQIILVCISVLSNLIFLYLEL